ncbi:hypothetical protein C1645_837009 [Glomus cerebriforme]|uniref:Uncharacterized protein n=1 Tax=Glomus cerebriforme TaxID=658196 RepID=A0A397S4X3_9GLOM|nr:hypothetical protein C1645_837009 [Glomus cerebriforme]
MFVSKINTPASTVTSVITTKEKNALTLAKLRNYGMAGRPVTRFVDFAKELSKCKLKSFLFYKLQKDLEKILEKYKVSENDIICIPPFTSETEKIDADDKKLKYCINEIKCKIYSLGPTTGKNEVIHCSYIKRILYASIFITKRLTKKKIILNSQLEIKSGEATGRIDFTIKKIIDTVNEKLIAITEGKQKDLVIGFIQNVMQLKSSYHTNTRKRKISEAFDNKFNYLYEIVITASDWYFLMYTSERIYCSKVNYHIVLTKDVFDNNRELRQGVKKVIKVIVGLLKDRVEIDLLRQENVRLITENVEFKAKYNEAKDEITKLRAELRNRIKELEKARINTAIKNTRRDVKNVRYDTKNAKLKAKVVKLKEDFMHP